MNRGAFLLIVLVAGVAGARADTDTDMLVEVGWGGVIRMGKWTPIFVTVTDPQPRQCVLEMYAPHDTTYSMRIRQGFAIGPVPSTYPLYAPMTSSMDSTSITLTDVRTKETLAREILDEPQKWSQRTFVNPGEILIGVSGRSTTQQMLVGQLRESDLRVGFLETARLPVVPAGYDSLDVLVFNAPDLNRVSVDQQNAIVSWVRGGGNLLFWPSEDALPPSSPILSMLPCRIGENRAIELTPAQVEGAGFLPRFTKLGARELSLLGDDVERIQFLPSGAPTGFRRRVGFGQVVVLPADVSLLQFKDRSASSVQTFWKPILSPLVKLPEKSDKQNNQGWMDQQRRVGAIQQNMDLIGRIPGVGSFGFGYVATVMVMMILVVGPIDYLILKRMGRQPWTWFTTLAWITLITAGAVFAGHLFKSGDLHFRTMRLIDQADGLAAATTDLVCIYSPRTTYYDLKVQPETWWQPASAENYYSGSKGLRSDVPFAQDDRGNHPGAMRINVWNLRFIEGETIEPGAPLIDAALQVVDTRVTGTISNRSDKPLKNLVIRHQRGVCNLGGVQILPGTTTNVNATLDKDTIFTPPQDANQNTYYYGHHQGGTGTLSYRYAGDLADRRSRQLDTMLVGRADLACVYAECADPPAAVTVEQVPAFEQHWRIVRALVELKDVPGGL